MQINEIGFLKELFSRKSLNPMSGNKKRAYKYSLCGIFINLINGRHTAKDSKGQY